MSSPQSDTASGRHCTECGMAIPADLKECPHDEGIVLAERAITLVGTTIGDNYEIVELVGIGGMSAVYRAKHRVLERVVALKLLHPHLASHPASLRRFEQEAKAISHLSHPNIVGVFEYGISPQGQPFLIMDYLEGISLAQYLYDKKRLSVELSLDLFIIICDALAHAHKKGILHRDIKPSNVMLVESQGNDKFVKLVDFGLAKLMPGADIEVRRLTQTGEIFGSPIYMSPEQVMGQTLDPRSDIFSLGCVMYEALAGEPPFVGKNLMEIMYMRLTDDPKPFDPALSIPKDLETIILLSLAREPAQRYRSMSDLKRDLELVKQGDSAGLRKLKRPTARKVLKKVDARLLAGMVALVVASLSFAIWKEATSKSAADSLVSAWKRFDESGQKQYDQGNYVEAEKSLLSAVKEAEKFGQQDKRLMTSLEKLQEVYLAENKNAEAQKIEDRLVKLEEKTILQDKAGNLYELAEMTLGLVPKSIQNGDTAEYQRLAEKLNQLALLFVDQQDYQKADELLKRAYLIEKTKPDFDQLTIAATISSQAVLYGKQGNYEQAQRLFSQAMDIKEKKLGPDHPEIASSLYNLAILSEDQGNYKKAEDLYKKALSVYQRAYGRDSPEVAMTVTGLGGLYRKQGKYTQAEPLFQEALSIYRKSPESEGTTIALSLNNLADLYYSQGKYADAAPMYEQAASALEKAVGVDHPNVATIINNLATVLCKEGQYAKAEPILRRALDIRQRSLPPDHPEIAQSLNSLAELFRSQHKYAEAQPLYKRALAISSKSLGPEHPDVSIVLNSMGQLYEDQQNYSQAESLFKQALAIREKAYGDDHPQVAQNLYYLADLHVKQGKLKEAEPLFQKALAVREAKLGPQHPDVATTLDGYSALMYKLNRFADAINYQWRAAAIRLRSQLPFL